MNAPPTFAIRALPPERVAEMLMPISTNLGFPYDPARAERFAQIPELDTRLGAFDLSTDALVGAAGSFGFEMTTPGGRVPTAGLTTVAVLATHRRRGILTAIMREYLDAAHARRVPVSALWAAEGAIYGRYGYGVASLAAEVRADTARVRFPAPAADGRRAHFRVVSEETAAAAFPAVWDRARAATPGMLSRSAPWWAQRRLGDPPEQRRGGGNLQRVLLELDGQPAGYALYRIQGKIEHGAFDATLNVREAVGVSPEATRALWRYLFEVDLVRTVEATLLPVDHPLLLLALEPRRLNATLSDALWVRLLDVPAALAARTYDSSDRVVLELSDAFCPWNAGRWAVSGARREAAFTDEPPDLALDVAALGSAYLGAFSFTQLAAAGVVTERTAGALARADALFRSPRAPWCPEIF